MRKILYLISGPNGCGKTTFLKNFVKEEKLKYIEADEIAKKHIKKDALSEAMYAGKIALRKLKEFKKQNISFVFESTLSGKLWKNLIPEFQKNDYDVIIYYIYLDTIEEAIERIKIRREKNGHYIPDKIVIRRFNRSIKNFWKIYKNISDKWFIINNSRDTPSLVAFGKKKNIRL